ncbi:MULTISPECIES: hypothetical protein [Halobacillus]|uniref:hypothetical protein n=1 Tax=Halobacillus TaxID=45667 RepID=UPI00136F9561|nr:MULTISPECIES: hypothetical protein [Halobacillus]MYL31263.1 hypothetical protein [Halobacillus halophilus]MYL39577.1 hypothetical protein [Halobacillus litoralis]
MAIKINYTTSNEDMDPYIDYLFKHSKSGSIFQIFTVVVGIILLTSSQIFYKNAHPEASVHPMAYIFLYTVGLGLYIFITFKGIKKKNKKALLKRKDRFIGGKEVYLTDESIQIIHKETIEKTWSEVDSFVRDDPYIYIHIEKDKIIHQIKPGTKIAEVESYLKQKSV